MKNIKLLTTGWINLFLILGCSIPGILFGQKSESTPEIKIIADPRVELMSIIFRLAGNGEYNQRGVIPYVKDIESHFDQFKKHAVVEMAKSLRKNAGIGFDAPMSLAVYLTHPPQLEERIDFEKYPELLDERWTTETVRDFLKEVRQFVQSSDFMRFFNDHEEFYSVILERAQNFINEEVHLEWFTSFFSNDAEGQFILALAPNNGGPSYGSFFLSPDGEIEYYSILGLGYPFLDEHQVPVFENLVFLTTIIHEFCHSFVNPFVDRHQSEFRTLGEKLFPLVKSSMKNQAYPDWETMMKETLVRTCVTRYLMAFKGEEVAKTEMDRQMTRGFVLVEKLFNLLGEFESHRESYPTFASFIPRIILSLNEIAENPDEFAKIQNQLAELNSERMEVARKRFEELKAHPERLPKVVGTVPADGETYVDPGLKEIRIEFDRPMNQNTMFIDIENTKFPDFTGKYRWESMNTIFILSVNLVPDTEYGYGLNSELAQYFADEKGNPLLPVVIRFKTRSR